MRRKSVSLIALVLVAVLGFAVAGCGGGKKSSSATTAAATTTEAAATTEAPPTTAAATTAKTPDLSAFASSKNCRAFAELASKLGQALSGTGGTDLEKFATFMHQLADKAPSDIKGDFQVLADAYTKIADALKGVNLSSGKAPSADVLAKLQKLGQEIDQPKLNAASQHISGWAQKNCHA